jgi:NAD(P)-dependent dehydrogenase (short-subunit alcohol dehydrogenase family)
VKRRKVVPIALDLRSPDSIKAAFEKATTDLGDLDLLVNHANRTLLRPVTDVTDADWDDVIDTNLKGAFFLSQIFGRACIARGRPGVIVNIASPHGMAGIAGRSVFGISKAGMIQMTRVMATEWAGNKIRVHAIVPSTGMTPARPEGRFATPEEVAAAVVHLAAAVTAADMPVTVI